MVIEATEPNKVREIQAELTELRRRIVELERTKQQLEQQVPPPVSMTEVAPPVTTHEELVQTLHNFVRRVASILQAEKCVIMLHEKDAGELVAQYPAYRFTEDEAAEYRVVTGTGVSGEAFRKLQPVICHDCLTDPRCIREGLVRFGIHDSLTVPMIVEKRDRNQQLVESTPIGVIHVFNKRYGMQFTEEDIRLLTVMARNAAAIISTARAFFAITNEKKQLETALQSMTSGLLSISTEGLVQLINATAARIFNVSDAEIIGRPFQEFITCKELVTILKEALRSVGEVRGDFAVNERFYQAQTAPILDDKASVSGILCVFNDITELHNVEKLKSDFVSTVSHELRTPLTVIKGFVRTLLDDAEETSYDREMRMEFYGIIDNECDRLVRLINDLLSVSRIERGLPLQLNYAKVDAVALTERCVNFHRNYSEKHTLELQTAVADPIIPVDSDKLDQVLSNLISNAIKYSFDGGPITITIVDEDNRLHFAVADKGIGIPPEHIDRIFLRFHRVHSGDSQRVSGTGIGLFLVQHLVEAHGGNIWVESTVGEGSTFHFTIPRHPPKENEKKG